MEDQRGGGGEVRFSLQGLGIRVTLHTSIDCYCFCSSELTTIIIFYMIVVIPSHINI